MVFTGVHHFLHLNLFKTPVSQFDIAHKCVTQDTRLQEGFLNSTSISYLPYPYDDPCDRLASDRGRPRAFLVTKWFLVTQYLDAD